MEPIDSQIRPDLRERGLVLWVGLALGLAGIIVTIGGIYEWHKRRVDQAPALRSQHFETTNGTTGGEASWQRSISDVESLEISELRRQLAEERRARIEAESRAFQREQEAASKRPHRCIDGVRFEQIGREWRNVGRC